MSALTLTPISEPAAASALVLLRLARNDVALGHRTPEAAQRFPVAWRAAMHAASGVLAVRARPAPEPPHLSPVQAPRPRTDIWSVLEQAAPEWSEWAHYFAATTRRRIRRGTGVRTVTPREADDLLRNAEIFLDLVEASLRRVHVERPAHAGQD